MCRCSMGKVKDIWERTTGPFLLVVALAAVLAVAGGIAIYLERQPPDDVSNSDAEFVEGDTQKPIVGVANWPTYGQNNARTRYLPDRGRGASAEGQVAVQRAQAARVLADPPRRHDLRRQQQRPGVRRQDAPRQDPLAQGDREPQRLLPAFSNGSLFISNLEPGQVQALRARDGKRWWLRELPGRTESSPVVVDDLVIVGCECGTLFALDRVTGKTVWETDLGGEIKAAPAVSEGVAYVGDYGGNFTAVNISDGSVKWTYGGAGDFYGTAAVAFGRVYVGSKDGSVYSFEKESGDLAWRHAIGGEVYAGAVAADTPNSEPTVYFGVFGGSTFYRARRADRRRALVGRLRRLGDRRREHDRRDRLRRQPRHHRDLRLRRGQRREGLGVPRRRLQPGHLRRQPHLPDRQEADLRPEAGAGGRPAEEEGEGQEEERQEEERQEEERQEARRKKAKK